MSWTTLKAAIAAAIKPNNNQEITGTVLQNTLNSIVNSVGANATFAGIATPSTSPGTPDGPVFYIAGQGGTYSNFGNQTITVGTSIIGVFTWDGSTWSYNPVVISGVASTTDLNNAIRQEATRAEEAFDNLELEDVTGSGTQATQLSIALRKNDGTDEDPEYRTLDTINIPSATEQKAGLMSTTLLVLLNNLANDGYKYKGIATPNTNPGQQAINCFYFAKEAGIYINFDNLELTAGLNILKWNGTIWSVETILDSLDGGIFDISTYHPDGQGNPAVYENLATALGANGANVPEALRKGGMSVKFVQVMTPAYYTVVKTVGIEIQPAGTELSTDPNVNSGTYTEVQLSAFSLLPASPGAGNALTYWMEVTGDTLTYTSWVITMVRSSDNKYVQHRYMGTEITGTPNPFLDISNWQGISFEGSDFDDSNATKKAKLATVGSILEGGFYSKVIYPIGVFNSRLPNQSEGSNGDYALFCYANNRVYQKIEGSWVNVTSLMTINTVYICDGIVYTKESLLDSGKFIIRENFFTDRINFAGDVIEDWTKSTLTIIENGEISSAYINKVYEISAKKNVANSISKSTFNFSNGCTVGFLIKSVDESFNFEKILVSFNTYYVQIASHVKITDIGNGWKFMQVVAPNTFNNVEAITSVGIIFDLREISEDKTFYISDLQVCEYAYPIDYHLFSKEMNDSLKIETKFKTNQELKDISISTELNNDVDSVASSALVFGSIFKNLNVSVSGTGSAIDKVIQLPIINRHIPFYVDWETSDFTQIYFQINGQNKAQNIKGRWLKISDYIADNVEITRCSLRFYLNSSVDGTTYSCINLNAYYEYNQEYQNIRFTNYDNTLGELTLRDAHVNLPAKYEGIRTSPSTGVDIFATNLNTEKYHLLFAKITSEEFLGHFGIYVNNPLTLCFEETSIDLSQGKWFLINKGASEIGYRLWQANIPVALEVYEVSSFMNVDTDKNISLINPAIKDYVFLNGDFEYVKQGSWQSVDVPINVQWDRNLYYEVGAITYPSAQIWQPICQIRIYDSNNQTLLSKSVSQNESGYIDMTLYPTGVRCVWLFYMTTDTPAAEGSEYAFNDVKVYQNSVLTQTRKDVDDLIPRVANIENSLVDFIPDWKDKIYSCYGDSITGICNGDFEKPYNNTLIANNWGARIANYYGMSKLYGRGIGGQSFGWYASSGAVTWVTPTGVYINRLNEQNYDNWDGVTYPTGVTAEMEQQGLAIRTRGCGCSWKRITDMYPASTKDTIQLVTIMFVNDADHPSKVSVEASFVPNSIVDTEWAASSYYSTYGGDYNIQDSTKGSIASTIMKLQAWMPNAILVLCTPLSGSGVTGELDMNFSDTNVRNLSSAVKDISDKLSIPCINLYGTCGINGLNRTRFIHDTVHPYINDGKMMLARAIIGGIKSILPWMS